jgi:hypothetical protein
MNLSFLIDLLSCYMIIQIIYKQLLTHMTYIHALKENSKGINTNMTQGRALYARCLPDNTEYTKYSYSL